MSEQEQTNTQAASASAPPLEVQQVKVQPANSAPSAAGGGDDEEEEFDIATLRQAIKTQKVNNKNGGHKAYLNADPHKGKTEGDFAKEAKQVFKAEVFCFSAAQDNQTAADVYDVASFGLPKVDKKDPAVASGGACTNAIQSTLLKRAAAKNSAVVGALAADLSFGDLLVEMRHVLKGRNYSQNPSLSCSHQIDLHKEKFTIVNPREEKVLADLCGTGGGRAPRRKALLLGINYVDHPEDVQLNGCVNDAKMVYGWLKNEGWKVEDKNLVRYFTDDKSWTMGVPTGENILKQLQWLVSDARAGDSLVLHMSGHGLQLPDDDGDEEDGYDEAYAAVDFDRGGTIRDEVFFKTLAPPLPEGVRLVIFADCCHSGSIMDLPYTFEASDENLEKYMKGEFNRLLANAVFSFDRAKTMVSDVANGLYDGAADLHRTMVLYFQKNKCCACC